jgi:tripartite-type tricarboxylate transporter receptor subunit TctC
MIRRNFLGHPALLASAATGWTVDLATAAPEYPTKNLRLVVPWPAGGLVDLVARKLGQQLQVAMNRRVIVENRIGAGGNIGALRVAKATPDGHTLLLSSSSLTINLALKTANSVAMFDALDPLALLARAPSVLVVGPAHIPATLDEMIRALQARKGRASYASAGTGSPGHLFGELFKSSKNFAALHVPYHGADGAINAQLSGLVDFQFANVTVAMPHIRSGRLKALAVTGEARFEALQDTPTMVECGVPDFDADQWLGLFGPKGMPGSVTTRLLFELNVAVNSSGFRDSLALSGIKVAAQGTPASFAGYLLKDVTRWRELVVKQGIQSR